MSSDRTQQQSPQELVQAKDLSLQRTRPPVDIPGYEAQYLLGQGAFGEVWVGTDRNTGRRVAIKFYTQRTRLDWIHLSREVEKLVFLSADRYVVQLLDVGWDSDPPYYVMEYVENGSLAQLLQQRGALATGEATEMFREIAIGLLHAHGKGVLHCDLKPANILLDQDHKPRLADFGQSRLSHEQSPALGTLFYMAPEQADLEAVPDVRWDVYALGAILYCMLCGSPPHRDDQSVERIDTAKGLVERLDRYRQLIRSSPPPSGHRRIAGVDRTLADMVDRCLAVDPQQRFANVQSILDTLNSRDMARVRTPLVFLGFVGPVLLLMIMALFGLRGYDQAMDKSEEFISFNVRARNNQTAEIAAQSIQREIDDYFRLIHDEAREAGLHKYYFPVAESEMVADINQKNLHGELRGEPIEALLKEFVQQEARLQLNAYLAERLRLYASKWKEYEGGRKIASLFAVDAQGRMLAAAYDQERTSRSIGYNYAFRSYFHGRVADLEYTKFEMPQGVMPIRAPNFSAAFRSTTSDLWKVAVSTPILKERGSHEDDSSEFEVVGVLALTVDLGDLAFFRSNSQQDRSPVVLIDGRKGRNRGVILQHPLFDRMHRIGRGPDENYQVQEYRVTDEQLLHLRSGGNYRDPLAQAPGGEEFQGDLIAAVHTVRLPETAPVRDSLIVLVQEPFAAATAPLRELGSTLKREGLWALGGVLAVILVLWYIVLRMLSEPRIVMHHRASNGSLSTSVHSNTTFSANPAADP